jgi:multiple sugar transport system permease protein
MLTVVILWSVAPVYVTVTSAFKRPLDIFAYPPMFIPKHWTFANIRYLFQSLPEFRTSLVNSALVAFATIVLMVIVSLLAAYGLSRHPSRALRILGLGTIILGMFPAIVVTVPLFPMLKNFGLDNSKITLVILYAALQSTVVVWIMKSFIDTIPRELEEAAYVDGASQWRAFRSVILPLARPIIVTGVILAGVFAWNEYTFALLFTSGENRTAPIIIAGMINDLTGANWGAILAASTIQLIPAVAVLLLVQRHLVRGLSAGAVKG